MSWRRCGFCLSRHCSRYRCPLSPELRPKADQRAAKAGPFAGMPAPTGSSQVSRLAQYLWERPCVAIGPQSGPIDFLQLSLVINFSDNNRLPSSIDSGINSSPSTPSTNGRAMSSPQHPPASPALATLIQRSGRPSPTLSETQAHAVLQAHYGVAGNLRCWAASKT